MNHILKRALIELDVPGASEPEAPPVAEPAVQTPAATPTTPAVALMPNWSDERLMEYYDKIKDNPSVEQHWKDKVKAEIERRQHEPQPAGGTHPFGDFITEDLLYANAIPPGTVLRATQTLKDQAGRDIFTAHKHYRVQRHYLTPDRKTGLVLTSDIPNETAAISFGPKGWAHTFEFAPKTHASLAVVSQLVISTVKLDQEVYCDAVLTALAAKNPYDEAKPVVVAYGDLEARLSYDSVEAGVPEDEMPVIKATIQAATNFLVQSGMVGSVPSNGKLYLTAKGREAFEQFVTPKFRDVYGS